MILFMMVFVGMMTISIAFILFLMVFIGVMIPYKVNKVKMIISQNHDTTEVTKSSPSSKSKIEDIQVSLNSELKSRLQKKFGKPKAELDESENGSIDNFQKTIATLDR